MLVPPVHFCMGPILINLKVRNIMNFNTLTTKATEIFNSVEKETRIMRNQLWDATTETGKSTIAVAEMTTGSMLVVATATRMATQGIAGVMPKNKKEAKDNGCVHT